jgi:hypothetical protein
MEIRRTVSKNHCPQYLKLSKLKLPFVGDTSKISLQVAQAMPWFGMPDLERSLFAMNGHKTTIPELNKLGMVGRCMLN